MHSLSPPTHTFEDTPARENVQPDNFDIDGIFCFPHLLQLVGQFSPSTGTPIHKEGDLLYPKDEPG
jgi:hypothetical protein